MENNEQLVQLLSQKITQKSQITFKEFMETVLYHPQVGYYTSTGIDIGSSGDFYTSSNVHPVFGWCLAQQVYDMWEVLGCPDNFCVVELGAGTGILARDILNYLQSNFNACFNSLTYQIAEVSSTLKETQKKTLQDFIDKIAWGIPQKPITGLFFSNEFFDALPVHRIKKVDGEIKEIFVVLEDGKLVEKVDKLSHGKEILDYLLTSGVKLKEGQQIEVSLESIKWLQRIEENLKKGFHLAIDYGYISSELLWPHRFDGTLMCYKDHEAVNDPFQNLGQQDITAHVNFSALQKYGENFGLCNLGYTNQMKFLVNLDIFQKLQIGSCDFNPDQEKEKLALKRLIMPEGMGETFKVLIQNKGLGKIKLKSLKNFG